MEKGTRKAPSAVVNIRTRFCPIVQWMEFIFLPSMTFYASKMVLTSLIIIDHNLIVIPVWAGKWLIVIQMRFSSEILPIVGIDTETFVVLGQVKRTPYCFVMEEEEIFIVIVIVDQVD